MTYRVRQLLKAIATSDEDEEDGTPIYTVGVSNVLYSGEDDQTDREVLLYGEDSLWCPIGTYKNKEEAENKRDLLKKVLDEIYQ